MEYGRSLSALIGSDKLVKGHTCAGDNDSEVGLQNAEEPTMQFDSLLITGGAGFVGSNLAVLIKQRFPRVTVTAVDNLKRRGSELNLPRLRDCDIGFIHGDIRCAEDLETLPDFGLLIDCSAEPSVHAGAAGSPVYVINTNLNGTINCLEAARKRSAAVLFLSTSRVYPIDRLNQIPFREDETRYRWDPNAGEAGISQHGISEAFPLEGARSFYGASKLAGELLVQEYVHSYQMKALILRCGILAGPWQMGKVDQGVITLWVAAHAFKKPLQYIGFGGNGKQVRDLLHIEDLADLLVTQSQSESHWDGRVYNVGGGADVSVSLLELTQICESITGQRTTILPEPRTSSVDLRIYLTDTTKVRQDFDWCPTRRTEDIVKDIYQWIDQYRRTLGPILE